jgi:hypothetical protein
MSGTGKTSTTVLRVEERAASGHYFLGCDPHFFKPDSLTNAIKVYESLFLRPMARTAEEIKDVLTAFIDEFNARKSGNRPQPWQPVTLLVDEVGSLMDAVSPEEEEVKKLLPYVARICGQESRNFNMGGVFISQQATGLAWLRKVSLMVIVHQLLMESEKKLALNGDSDAMKSMPSWPKGRTYVYGIGFEEGPQVVQQPYYAGRVVDAAPNALRLKSEPSSVSSTATTQRVAHMPETPRESDTETAIQAVRERNTDELGNTPAQEPVVSSEKNIPSVSADILETISRMKKANMSDRDIAAFVGLSGRKYRLYQQAVAQLGRA